MIVANNFSRKIIGHTTNESETQSNYVNRHERHLFLRNRWKPQPNRCGATQFTLAQEQCAATTRMESFSASRCSTIPSPLPHSASGMDSPDICEPPQDEQEFCFRYPSYMFPDVEYDKEDVPLPFKASPDSLFNLCAAVVDSQARTEVFKWSINDVTDWLRNFGYPEYEVG